MQTMLREHEFLEQHETGRGGDIITYNYYQDSPSSNIELIEGLEKTLSSFTALRIEENRHTSVVQILYVELFI